MTAKVVVPIVGKRGKKYDIVSLVEWKANEGDQVENSHQPQSMSP